MNISNLFIEIYNDEPYCYNYTIEDAKGVVNKWKNNGIIITCSIDNQLVGFIGGYYLDKTTLYLDKIGVKKEYRNNKIGTKMMKKLVKNNISIFLRINDRKLENFYFNIIICIAK